MTPSSRLRRTRRLFPLVHEAAIVLIVATVLALFARTFIFQAYTIPTSSMEPELLVGDYILVNKFAVLADASGSRLSRFLLPTRPPRRGDLLVFRHPLEPDRELLKRCLGLDGDVVEIRDKRLLLDGQVIEESYTLFDDPGIYLPSELIERPETRHRDNWGPQRVAEEELFCLGDRRDISVDSRALGTIDSATLRGRALLVYWSFDRAPAEPYSGSRLGSLLRRVEHTLRSVRVERLLHVVH